MTSGCSWISLAMKWRKLPLSTSSELATDLMAGRSTLRPSKSKISRRLAGQHRAVAVLQIGDRVGEGRQRDGVGAEIHLALAVADGERRSLPRADHQVVLAGEDDGERERALQPLQGGLGRLDRRQALIQIVGDEMQHRLGVGLGLEHVALGGELVAQLLEVLDDAVVHDGDALVHVRMGVALDRLAVRRPARVAEAGVALQRMVGEPQLEVLELALGAPAVEMAVLDGGDAGRIIAAIFEPPQGVDEIAGDRLRSKYADDAAHASFPPPRSACSDSCR